MRKFHLYMWSSVILVVISSMSYMYYSKVYEKEKINIKEIQSSQEKDIIISESKETETEENNYKTGISGSEESEELKNLKKYRYRPVRSREVFLTFDDGPSKNNTKKILRILEENNIKATFFVIGKKAEENPDIIKELYKSGMCIVPHTYSHDYKIYQGFEKYMEDLDKCKSAIKNIIGTDTLCFIRMPGGSDNKILRKSKLLKIKSKLKEKGYSYIDWNVSSADAAMETVPMYKIKENVINQCRHSKFAVVLMHDSHMKTTSAEALPDIVKFLKKEGFIFRTFDDITPEEQDIMIKIRVMNR